MCIYLACKSRVASFWIQKISAFNLWTFPASSVPYNVPWNVRVCYTARPPLLSVSQSWHTSVCISGQDIFHEQLPKFQIRHQLMSNSKRRLKTGVSEWRYTNSVVIQNPLYSSVHVSNAQQLKVVDLYLRSILVITILGEWLPLRPGRFYPRVKSHRETLNKILCGPQGVWRL